MALTGFICHDSYLSKTNKLTDEEVGRLFRALMTYHSTGNVVEVEGRESVAFDFIKDDIDRADEAYRNKCETNRRNRMRTNNNDREQSSTNVNEREQPTTDADNNKNKNKNKNKNNNKEVIRRFTPPTLEEVSAYCKERSNTVDPQRFIDFYASKGWKVGNQPMKDWKACVRTWEQRDDHQPKQQTKKVIAQDFPQRDYSGVNDELIDELAAEMAEFMGA